MADDVSGTTRSSHPWIFAVATLAVLATVNFLHEILSHFAAYRALHDRHSFYVPEGIDKLNGVVVCVFAVALTRRVTPHMGLISILFLTVLSPMVEEIEFRGLGVRNLQRGTGWPFWVLVWPQALLFGWGHVEQGQSIADMVGLMLLTGSGAVVFAWWATVELSILTRLSVNPIRTDRDRNRTISFGNPAS